MGFEFKSYNKMYDNSFLNDFIEKGCDQKEYIKKYLLELVDGIRGNINNLLDFSSNNEYDLKVIKYADFLKFVYLYEDKYNIKIKINRELYSLGIFSDSGFLIGEILQSDYNDENFHTCSHLYNVVEKEYRGLGYGKIMYKLYCELSKVDDTFFLPSIEYTNVVSMIDFYIKNGFRVKSKLISGNEELITTRDIAIFRKIKKDYMAGLKELILPYTIILEKK